MTAAVGIYLFNDVEVLDFAGPFEVFTTATRVDRRENASASDCFRVFTITVGGAPARARGGLTVASDYALENHPPIDLLIIPGGVVAAELQNEAVVEWIARQARSTKLVASVCTGAFLLAQAGLLDGKRATTHWEDIADLQAKFSAVTVLNNQRWIDEGPVVTSAGIAAGIDMALHLVERYAGRALALRTARQMDVIFC